MNVEDVRWLAAIFEGEGSCGIYFTHHGKNIRPMMSITNYDPTMLLEIQRIAGGKITKRGVNITWERAQNVRELLMEILPYMRSRYKISQAVNTLYNEEMEGLNGAHQFKFCSR